MISAAANPRLTAAVFAVLLGFGLQGLLVHIRFDGNWTALFCTGSAYPTPPSLAAEEIYIFPDSRGYDGQMYHYVAHDPLARSDLVSYIDNARVRYRRILLPGLAFLAAFGQQQWIDEAYIAVNLAFLFLGAWWLAGNLQLSGYSPRWAVFYVLAPAVLISLERLTVDLAFTSLILGFAFYLRRGDGGRAWIIAALACLTRDTGFLLVAGLCISLLWQRSFAKAFVAAAAALPAMAWFAYSYLRTPDYSDERFAQLIPFLGVLRAIAEPAPYAFSPLTNAVLAGLDRAAILGFLLAVVLAIRLALRNGPGALEISLLLWSFAGLCLPHSSWIESYSGGRVFTPLTICVLLLGIPRDGRGPAALLWTAPALLSVPRIAIQVVGPLFLS